MMKRFIFILAALAMLIWICPPAQAEYRGIFKRDQGWLLNVDNSASAGKTAITVHFYGKRFEDIEFGTVGAGPQEGRVQLVFPKPGKDVTRIVIEVDPPSQLTEVRIEVNQNESFFATFIGYGRMVFEVE